MIGKPLEILNYASGNDFYSLSPRPFPLLLLRQHVFSAPNRPGGLQEVAKVSQKFLFIVYFSHFSIVSMRVLRSSSVFCVCDPLLSVCPSHYRCRPVFASRMCVCDLVNLCKGAVFILFCTSFLLISLHLTFLGHPRSTKGKKGIH